MRRKPRLLIVDDEPNIGKILQASFDRVGCVSEVAHTADEALGRIKAEEFDLVLTDVLMPGMTGVELLKEAKKLKPELPFVIMTAYGTIPQAVEAMREGAADYLTKPFDLDVVKKTVAHHLKRRAPKKAQPAQGTGFIAESPQMKAILELVEKVADSTASVLITGESGTGKEVIAKAIHARSSRAANPFVAVNCAALPEGLLESELFGHEKGAFTGAETAKPGRFELANTGTLFLDEIGEIPLAVQVKLLRVLQEREIERLGSTKSTPVDVRVVAATNQDLQAAVTQRRFREDLFFRLQVLHIELAPLRDRKADILPLAEHFLGVFAERNGSSLAELAPEAEAALVSYRWPGNVRELENVIERAVVLAPKGAAVLTPDLLPPQLHSAA